MRLSKLSALILGMVVTAGAVGVLWAKESRVEPNVRSDSVNPSSADGEFTMHEWGTFTTFSGSDGVFLEYRPLAQQRADLPAFVWDRATHTRSGIPTFSKARVFARVRMETPVTYFYTDRVRSVDVSVDFPKGMLTEFYPPVRKMLPAFDPKLAYGKGEAIGDSSLDWGRIELIPVDELVPSMPDSEMRDKLIDDVVSQLLPTTMGNDHYGAARETDSALVRLERDSAFDKQADAKTANPWPTPWPLPTNFSYFEKFLFYRGVGKFDLPYKVTFEGDSVVMSNQSDLAMSSAILIDANAGKIRACKVDGLRAGQAATFPEGDAMTEDELAKLVQESLVAEGLYEKEALAMVNVWRKSWFTENGTRILYMVPQTLTDELIPLHINPAPKDSVRVLVGRMEVMSPTDEEGMIALVKQSAEKRRAFYANANRDPKSHYQLPASIRDFGRMAEPALIRVSKIISDPAVKTEAEALIAQFRSA